MQIFYLVSLFLEEVKNFWLALSIDMKLLEEVNKKLKTNDVRGKMKRVDQSTLLMYGSSWLEIDPDMGEDDLFMII